MSDRYKHIEIVKDIGRHYPNLDVSISNSSKLKIYRALSGTCNCYDDFIGKEFKLRTNYFKLSYEPVKNRVTAKRLLDNFEDSDITLEDLNQYFSDKRNNEFYSKLANECIKCLIYHQQGYEIATFIHLYRVLECMSYSLPLIYAAKAREFVGSYRLLQKLMTSTTAGNADGELNFFKKFVSEIYGKEDFYCTTFDIKFDDIEPEEERAKLYKLISKLAGKKTVDSTENEELKIGFIDFYELLITIRNRYFHLSQGQWAENISNKHTEYPELLFRLIVDKGINFFSVLIFEILKFEIDHYPLK